MKPATVKPYRAPWWMPGAHSQTIVPALFHREPAPTYVRERWSTPDGDFIDLDWAGSQPVADKRPLLVLFHGLEGSAQSHYARAFMNLAVRRGWAAVVPHFRGCSGEMNLAPRFYHSGDAAEIEWILRRMFARYCVGPGQQGRPLYVAGVSLGGNALLRFLGERGADAGFVRAAAAISAPLDLTAGGRALSSGFNMVYTRMFLRTLKEKCERKLVQFPDLFDAARMRASRNLYEFDEVVTAPLHGYRGVDDYWRRASSLPLLDAITVPTLVLNARNDPFVPAYALPAPRRQGAVRIEQPAQGGHVGFMRGRLPLRGDLGWMPAHVLDFLDHRHG